MQILIPLPEGEVMGRRYLVIIAILVMTISSCGRLPSVVVGDISPTIKHELILKNVTNFTQYNTNGNNQLICVAKESAFYPEFNKNHIVVTDLNGNQIDSNLISSDLINDSIYDKTGQFIGNVIVKNLFYAATGQFLPIGFDDDIFSLKLDDSGKWLAFQKNSDWLGTELFVIELKTGNIVARIGKSLGQNFNIPIGFIGGAFYSLSSSFKKSNADGAIYYLTSVDLFTGQQKRQMLPDDVMRWFVIYVNFNGNIIGISKDGKIKKYNVITNQVVADIQSTEGTSNPLCVHNQEGVFFNLNSSVTEYKDSEIINRISFYPCDNLSVNSLSSIDSGASAIYENNSRGGLLRLLDYDGSYSKFGILSEYLAPNTFSAILNYENNSTLPIYSGKTIVQDEIIVDNEKLYYYFVKKHDGLYRVNLTNLIGSVVEMNKK